MLYRLKQIAIGLWCYILFPFYPIKSFYCYLKYIDDDKQITEIELRKELKQLNDLTINKLFNL